MKQSTMKKWRLLGIVLVAFIVGVVGCPETEQMMKPVVDEVMDDKPADTTPPTTVGEVKEPEEKPAEPTEAEQEETPAEEESAPADTTPPTVVEVAWYRDWQMTELLTADSTVHPGDTVYTVVVFSEPVVHTVAEDKTARPALFIVIDGMEERYKMLPHGVGFESGEAKPLRGGTEDYLCKYTIPADAVGTLALRVGDATVDTAGNTVTEALIHTAPFMVIRRPQPVVTIDSAMSEDDGSITVSGTSADIPAETTVTVTIDSIIAITTIDTFGNWTVTIPAIEANQLIAGTVIVTASAIDTSDSSSFEYEPPMVTEPEPPKPTSPTSTEVTLVEVGSDYTFTLEGHTYPGYNPSPNLQYILDTHPSAKLPNFEEAVKMIEVVDWVYRKVWEVYPNDIEKRGEARGKVSRQFGLTTDISGTLYGMYYDFLGHDPKSSYWLTVECLRLLLTYPENLRLSYPGNEYEEILRRFEESLEEGYIVGQTNPND